MQCIVLTTEIAEAQRRGGRSDRPPDGEAAVPPEAAIRISLSFQHSHIPAFQVKLSILPVVLKPHFFLARRPVHRRHREGGSCKRSRLKSPAPIKCLGNTSHFHLLNFATALGAARPMRSHEGIVAHYRKQKKLCFAFCNEQLEENRKWFFEVGGKGKKGKQLPASDTSYVLADDLEIGLGRKIPLWLFGFLY